MTLVDLLTVVVLAVVGVRLFEAARSSVGAREETIVVVRGLRWRHFVRAILVLGLILPAAWVLMQLPVLSFGWWTALGGVGNPVVGTTEHSYGVAAVVLPIVFGTLLLLGLPLLVAREEWVFRRGAERRGTGPNAGRALAFGMAHAIVGIPLGAALALSIGGLYLTWCYLEGWHESRTEAGALLESTRAHLAYNMSVIALIVAYLVIVLALDA